MDGIEQVGFSDAIIAGQNDEAWPERRDGVGIGTEIDERKARNVQKRLQIEAGRCPMRVNGHGAGPLSKRQIMA